jgi:hypothetical protein
MQTFRTSTFLRRVLIADAATCAAAGLLLLLGASSLEHLFRLPPGLSRYAGASLLPFAALLAYFATRENLSPRSLWAVIVVNALWTADSILLLIAGWVEPNGLGSAFVVFQALGVAAFAALEYLGLRKSAAASAV